MRVIEGQRASRKAVQALQLSSEECVLLGVGECSLEHAATRDHATRWIADHPNVAVWKSPPWSLVRFEPGTLRVVATHSLCHGAAAPGRQRTVSYVAVSTHCVTSGSPTPP